VADPEALWSEARRTGSPIVSPVTASLLDLPDAAEPAWSTPRRDVPVATPSRTG
jgi:hypothetical protein